MVEPADEFGIKWEMLKEKTVEATVGSVLDEFEGYVVGLSAMQLMNLGFKISHDPNEVGKRTNIRSRGKLPDTYNYGKVIVRVSGQQIEVNVCNAGGTMLGIASDSERKITDRRKIMITPEVSKTLGIKVGDSLTLKRV